MTHLADYQVQQKLYQGLNTVVFSGLRIRDNLPVAIKVAASSEQDLARNKRLRREFRLGASMDSPYVIRYLELINSPMGLALVMENIGAFAVQTIIPEGGMDIERFLPLALEMALGLAYIHRQGIVHKDVKPSNILVYDNDTKIKYLDFGISSKLNLEYQHRISPGLLEGTLPYISPEQTGRINRPLDYRSDFYSLGATFYHMLTGSAPFQRGDSLEMIHNHLARAHIPVKMIRGSIPDVISSIVQKLMAKAAEDRYQSAEGLAKDLRRCLGQWQLVGKIAPFAPGQEDISEKFSIPNKLYGRDQEMTVLMASLKRTLEGACEMLLVVGDAGVGKSSLVFEMEKPLIEQKGFFCAGKFERYSRDTAYTAIAEAFGQLIHILLGEENHIIVHWRRLILQALGENIHAVTQVVPNLELIIGKADKDSKVLPMENRHGFHHAVGQLVSCFSSKEHPLLLFLENLQWADVASLELVEALMTNPMIRGMFVVGTVKREEPNMVLQLTLNSLASQQVKVPQIVLGNLDTRELAELVSETLHCPAEEAESLAMILERKTQGNPYFTIELLKGFHKDGLIAFDSVHQCWTWDEERVRGWAIPDNLAELVVHKLQALPKRTCLILCHSACVGTTFDLGVLSHILGCPKRECFRDLQPAVDQNLVIPLRSFYPIEENDEAWSEELSYRFQHHRVWQAAYHQASVIERAHIHLLIGRYLREHSNTESTALMIHHLNDARALLDDDEERTDLASLNLGAAHKAIATMAYKAALNYLEMGIDCLPLNPWQVCYRLCYQLHQKLAEAMYLSGDYEQAKSTWDTLHDNAQNEHDVANALELQMVHYVTMGDFSLAINAGLVGLKLLGVELPRHPNRLHLLRGMGLIRLRQLGKSIAEQANHPDVLNPHTQAVLNLLMRLNLATYFSGDRYLYALVAQERVQLALKHGNSPESANAFVTYGAMLSMRGAYGPALSYGELGLALDKRFRNQSLRCKVLVVYAFCIHSWHFHWREMTPYLADAIDSGLQSGDHLYCSMACMMIAFWEQCSNLKVAQDESERILHTLGSSGFRKREQSIELLIRFRLCLMGKTASRTSMEGDDFDEKQCLESIQVSGYTSSLALYYLLRVQLAFLYDEQSEAMHHLAFLEQHKGGIQGTPMQVLTIFFSFLVLVKQNKRQKLGYKLTRSLKGKLAQMRKWQALCQENCGHLADLMEAEFCGRKGAVWQATVLYRRAVDGARNHEFLMFQAISAECAYRFFQEKGHETMATAYLREADIAYQHWGAVAKVVHMRETSPNQLLDRSRRNISGDSMSTSSTTEEMGGESARGLKKVIQINSELSSEMDYQRLCRKIVNAALSTTKARCAALVDNQDGRLMVCAYAKNDEAFLRPPIPLAHCEYVCQRAVRQTVAKELALLLSDARSIHPYSQDSYVVTHGIKSILCVPIRYKDKVNGALYLENQSSVNAFTDADVSWLTMLAGPAAVSLENAGLYAQTREAADEVKNLNRELARLNTDLGARVRERTMEVEGMQRKLVEKAHLEGMSEIATSVLHNVGSILNSVITSCQTIETTIQGSRMPGLLKANEMLRENMHQVVPFLCDDPKGQNLLNYYLRLDKPYLKEKAIVEENISRLIDKVERIRAVILAQQSYSRAGFQCVELHIGEAVNDALSILSGELARANINVIRHYHTSKMLNLPKNKLIHLSVNLIRNALEAMMDCPPEARSLEIVLVENESGQLLSFKDTGKGINPEDLPHIFEHGFTTKSNSAGFGLHAAANAMTEMGGSVEVQSDVPGSGVLFNLHFPTEAPHGLERSENS